MAEWMPYGARAEDPYQPGSVTYKQNTAGSGNPYFDNLWYDSNYDFSKPQWMQEGLAAGLQRDPTMKLISFSDMKPYDSYQYGYQDPSSGAWLASTFASGKLGWENMDPNQKFLYKPGDENAFGIGGSLTPYFGAMVGGTPDDPNQMPAWYDYNYGKGAYNTEIGRYQAGFNSGDPAFAGYAAYGDPRTDPNRFMRNARIGGDWTAMQQDIAAESSGFRGFANGGGLAMMAAGGLFGAAAAGVGAASGMGSSYLGSAGSVASGLFNDNPLSALSGLAGGFGGFNGLSGALKGLGDMSWGANPIGGGMGDFGEWMSGMQGGADFAGLPDFTGGDWSPDWGGGTLGGAGQTDWENWLKGDALPGGGGEVYGGATWMDNLLSGAGSLGSGALSLISKLFGGGGAGGSGMWGLGTSIGSLLSGLFGNSYARDMEKTGTGLRNSVDATMGSRQIAAGQMNQLLNDPSSIVNVPGFDAGQLAINRNLAKLGYLPGTRASTDPNDRRAVATIPGNYLDAHSNFAGNFYNTHLDRLSKIAGSQFDPSNAAKLQLAGMEGAAGLTGAGTQSGVAGINGVLRNLFS